jgi:RNA polymerase sigma-70 factor (family 1)
MLTGDVHDEGYLLTKLADGDALAFDELFHLYWDHVYSAALIMTKSTAIADDLAQEVFISVWKQRDQMGVMRNFKGYLYTNVKFMVHKKLRRIKVEEAYKNFLVTKHASNLLKPEQEESFDLKQLLATLEHGIAQLPAQQQCAFRLSREQGLSHEQISEVMGVSKKTVKDYIVRAIAYLRPYLRQYSGYIWIALLCI